MFVQAKIPKIKFRTSIKVKTQLVERKLLMQTSPGKLHTALGTRAEGVPENSSDFEAKNVDETMCYPLKSYIFVLNNQKRTEMASSSSLF